MNRSRRPSDLHTHSKITISVLTEGTGRVCRPRRNPVREGLNQTQSPTHTQQRKHTLCSRWLQVIIFSSSAAAQLVWDPNQMWFGAQGLRPNRCEEANETANTGAIVDNSCQREQGCHSVTDVITHLSHTHEVDCAQVSRSTAFCLFSSDFWAKKTRNSFSSIRVSLPLINPSCCEGTNSSFCSKTPTREKQLGS